MNCEEFRKLLPLLADDELCSEQAIAASKHTQCCEDCARELRKQQFVVREFVGFFERLDPKVTPPPRRQAKAQSVAVPTLAGHSVTSPASLPPLSALTTPARASSLPDFQDKRDRSEASSRHLVVAVQRWFPGNRPLIATLSLVCLFVLFVWVVSGVWSRFTDRDVAPARLLSGAIQAWGSTAVITGTTDLSSEHRYLVVSAAHIMHASGVEATLLPGAVFMIDVDGFNQENGFSFYVVRPLGQGVGFRVVTPQCTLAVRGTRFAVRVLPEAGSVVYLQQGMLRVTRGEQTAIIDGGTLVACATESLQVGQVSASLRASIPEDLAWADVQRILLATQIDPSTMEQRPEATAIATDTIISSALASAALATVASTSISEHLPSATETIRVPDAMPFVATGSAPGETAADSTDQPSAGYDLASPDDALDQEQ